MRGICPFYEVGEEAKLYKWVAYSRVHFDLMGPADS